MSTKAEDNGTLIAAESVVLAAISCPQRMASLHATLAPLGTQIRLIGIADQVQEDLPILIVHMPPADALAHAMAEGQDVATALAEWRAQGEALLALLRRNRRRTKILTDTAFLSDPGQWLNGATSPATDKDASTALPPPDAVYLLLAVEALRRDAAARALAEELEASTAAALPEDWNAADLDSVRRLHAATRAEMTRLRQEISEALERLTAEQAEAAKAREAAAALNEEHEAVLGELLATQEKAREARNDRETLKKDLARQQAEMTALEVRLAEAERKGAESRAARERLEHQLHQLRQGLESTETQLSQAQEAQARLENDRRALAEKADGLAVSLSTSRLAETALREEAAGLQQTLATRDSELVTLTARLIEREDALNALTARSAEEQRTLAEMLAAREAALAETQEAQARLEEEGRLQARQAEELALRLRANHETETALREEAAGLQQTLATRDSELGTLTARLIEREDALNALTARSAEEQRLQADALATVRRELQAREEEIARFFASKSYRITWPLRMLRHLLMRGK
ncbi:MAG: hypothetical protein JJU19_14500 [Pararhodobacter sp.]|nr:hypothetical protein [Pararhodobacter sp.]